MVQFVHALLLFVCVASSSAVFAHARLVWSEPADAARLRETPLKVVLHFSEPVTATVLEMTDAAGRKHSLEKPARGRELVVPLPAPSLHGAQVVRYHVVSAEGHAAGGAITFSSAGPAERADAASARAPASMRAALWLGKVLLYIGLFVGVGGAFFIAWFMPGGAAPKRVVSHVYAALAITLWVAPLSIGVQGLDALAAALSRLTYAEPWALGMGSTYGATALLSLLAAVLALAAMRSPLAPARITTAAALLLVGYALAQSGHAATAEPRLLMRAAVFVHSVGITFWIGALLPLAALVSSPSEAARNALRLFSRSIVPFVAMVIAGGAMMAYVQLKVPGALWTSYGQLYATKLTILAVLFALAAWNRYKLTDPVLSGDRSAAHRLSSCIRAEVVMIAAILAISAGWRLTAPPNVLAAQARPPAAAHAGEPHASGTPAAMSMDSVAGAVPVLPDAAIDPRARAPEGVVTLDQVVYRDRPGTGEAREGGAAVKRYIVDPASEWTLLFDVDWSEFERKVLQARASAGRLAH